MTPSFAIPKGQKFLYEGKKIVFRYRARNAERSYVFEDENRLPYALSPEEVILARADNRLCDWVGVSVATIRSDRQICRARVTYSSGTEYERFLTDRTNEYIMEWVRNPKTPRTDRALQPLCNVVHARRVERASRSERKIAEPPCLSGSRLRQLIHTWKMGGEKADAIVTQHRFRGNYRTRLSQTVTEIMWEQTDAIFLKLNGVSVAKLHHEIGKKIREKNKEAGGGVEILSPSYEAVDKPPRGAPGRMLMAHGQELG